MQIIIHTDGAAQGNPGKGGYGVVLQAGKHYKEISQGYKYSTNNRMELLAVIVGLEAIKLEQSSVLIVSDSKYVVDSVEKKWVFGWEKKKFAKKKNPDLWARFLIVYRKQKVSFKWIKGHAGHPLNERCDVLAVNAANSSDLLVDEYYETIGSKLKD
jgi:ribonuclease HI